MGSNSANTLCLPKLLPVTASMSFTLIFWGKRPAAASNILKYFMNTNLETRINTLRQAQCDKYGICSSNLHSYPAPIVQWCIMIRDEPSTGSAPQNGSER
jgi:hypothetical protein